MSFLYSGAATDDAQFPPHLNQRCRNLMIGVMIRFVG